MKKSLLSNPYLTKKGIALLFTIGILALLSLLGTAFAINSLLEVKQAYNYNYAVKARYIAEAGIARAIAELKYGAQGARADALDTTLETWYTTGYSDSTLLGGLGQYDVSVVDCASRINLNDSNTNLAQILKNLNVILGSPLSGSDCDNIANNRPYLTRQMVKTALGNDQAKYDAIAPYITVYGFIDPYTVNPRDVATPYAVQSRAPINVNTASQQVIQAALMGLQSYHDCPACGGDGDIRGVCAKADGWDTSCTVCDKAGNLTIDSTEALNLAAYIVANRPYSTWSQFYTSVMSCPSIGSRDADLVIANANPNTGFSWIRNAGWANKLGYIGKFTIDWNKNGIYESAADSGLNTNTTEFSFNSGGYYEMTSTGTFKGASKTLTAVVKTYDIFRQTTQAQFETSGSSVTDVQTYPENRTAGVSAAAYDGQIMLARNAHTTPNASPYFRADYFTTPNPDAAGGNTALITPQSPSISPKIGTVVNFSDRGDFMPDGMLVDAFNLDAPIYYPFNNIPTDQGTMEIWFKPQYNSNDSLIWGDYDQDKRMYRVTSQTPLPGYTKPGGMPCIYSWFWSDYGHLYMGINWWGGQYDPITPKWDYNGGYVYLEGVAWPAGKWNQLVFVWANNPDPLNPSSYNSTQNPGAGYINGTPTPVMTYFYHTPYGDTDPDSVMYIGQDHSSYNWWILEFSDSVISSVRIWNEKLTNAQVQAEYQTGIYKIGGNFTSSQFNPGNAVDWGTITWTAAIPDGINGGITLDVDTTGTGSSFSGNWSDPSSGRPINGNSNAIKYRATFSASAAPLIESPVLEDVTITYLSATKVLYCQ